MKLYPWQKECLQAWEKNGRRGIVNVITGAGKTVFALAAMDQARKAFPDLVIRVVVPTIPLANQWQQSLLHHAPDENWRPGFFGNGRKDDADRRVMIYIINSARDSLAAHIRRDLALGRHILLVCDECHHYQSVQNRKIFGFLTPEIKEGSRYLCLGLSATPFGSKNDDILIRALGKEIYRYGFDAAVAEGVISPFVVCEISASFYPEELLEYADLTDRISLQLRKLLWTHPHLKGLPEREFIKAVTGIAQDADMDPEEPAAAFLMLTYERKKLTNLAAARLGCAISILDKLHSSDRIILFCERISQAEEMAVMIRRRFGNICGLYHSGMTKQARDRILDEFRQERLRILVSCKCLDEGLDVPDANIGIVLSSTAVNRQRVQRLGRVIRRAKDKDAACLYYIYIRESSEDAAYLGGTSGYESFSLRYYSAEDLFSNEIYEYVAGELLYSARKKGYPDRLIRELRGCMTEGLIRADYLLDAKAQKQHINAAVTKHEQNYWAVMQRIGREFKASSQDSISDIRV